MTLSKTRQLCSAALSVLIATSPLLSYAQSSSNTTTTTITSKPGTAIDKSQLSAGKRYFISTNSLNVRSSNSTTEKNVVGQLSINDEVEIYDLLNEATPLVQIKVIKSGSMLPNVAPELFISKDYLSEKSLFAESTKYFVIQNIATEKTRVYERCTETPSCPHKLVLETDMVVGRPEEGTKRDPHAFKTWLGHSKISEWVKFYQDGSAHYPHWYRAGQSLNSIPAPLTEGVSKIVASRKWMVKDSKGDSTIYGAFGWYAA